MKFEFDSKFRIKNSKFLLMSFSKFFLICILIAAWLFSGFPRIWQKPAIPPKIQEAQAAPGTQIKTAEFFITQYASATDITTGNGVNGLAYTDANDVIVNINLPETGVMTIRKAWVEWQTISASNVATDWQMKFARCTVASPCTTASARTANTLFPTVVSDPIEGGPRGQVFVQHMDVTSQIAAGNNDYFFNAQLTGDTRNSDSAKIFITYEYDDTSTTQLKTRRYLVGCGAAQAAAGNTTNYTVNPNILETGVTILSHWVEMTGVVQVDGSHNAVMNATSGSAAFTPGFGSADVLVKVLDSFATSNINLTTNNTIGLTNTTAAMNLKCGEWVVTYTYTGSSATQSNTVVYRAGQLSGSLPTATTTVGAPTVFLPESTKTFRSVYVRYVFANVVAGNFTPEVTIGATTCTGPAFAVSYTRTVSYDVVVWNINDAGGAGNCLNFFQTNWTSGATLTIKGAGSVTNAAEGVSAELVVTYTYDNSASATGIKTVYWWLGQDNAVNTANTAFTGTFDTFIPETTTTKRSSGIRVHNNVGVAAATSSITIAGAATTSVAYAAHTRGDTRWSNDPGANLTAASQTALAFSFNSNSAFISGGYGYTTYEHPLAAAAATISCSTNVGSTDFGTWTDTSIKTATPNASTTMSCSNTTNGCTLYVKDQGSGSNPGLWKSPDLIESPTAANPSNATDTLSAGAEGYGIQATTTSAGLTIAPRYLQTGDIVGGLKLTNTTVASSTADISNAQVIVTHKAAVSASTFSGSYSDTITYECTINN